MKIAFVLPVYKVREQYLRKSIESVIHQTYHDLEIILVDDGSPDDCGKICDEYARNDRRINVIHKRNEGLSAARNTGIDAVTAEWVSFVDSDDWVEADFAQTFADYILNGQERSDIYFFSGYRNYSRYEVAGEPYYETGTVFQSGSEREALQTKCFTSFSISEGKIKLFSINAAWAKVYRIGFLKEHGLRFPIVPYAEDSLFYLDAVEAARRIEYIAHPVYHYRSTEGSIVNSYRPQAEEEQQAYLDRIFDFCDRCHKSGAFRKKAYLRVMTSMIVLIKQYFFHRDNPLPFRERELSCRRLFGTEPYRSVFRNVPFFELRTVSKIKLILLWLRWYAVLEYLRRSYSRLRGRC